MSHQRSRLLVDSYAEALFAGDQQPRLLLDNYTEVSSATVNSYLAYWLTVILKRLLQVTSDLAYW